MSDVKKITTTVENTELGRLSFDYEIIEDYNAEFVVQTGAIALAESIRLETARRNNQQFFPDLQNIVYYKGAL